MKKFMLMLFAMLFVSLAVNAQNAAKKKRNLNENTVVTDSAGNRYPYAVWKGLVASKDYRLKKVDRNSDSSAYVLVKLDSVQKDRALSKMAKPKESKFFTGGESMSLFNSTDINGFKIRAKELKGKIVVLNFWFIGCKPCRKEMPELNELALQYTNDPNVIFIAVALDKRDDIQNFLRTTPFAYHIVDDGRLLADSYRINAFPTNVVVGADGKILFNSLGYKANTAYWIKKTIEDAKQAGAQ